MRTLPCCLFVFLALFTFVWADVPPESLCINEILSSNNSSEQDEDGDFSDWLEIWNAGSTAVDLTGWGLSDSRSNPFKWAFGAVTIQSSEFLLVWVSSKNRPAITNGNQLHASFAISAGGEDLLLTRPDGTRVDEVAAVAIPSDYSLGRQPDGTGPWKLFTVHTPRAANTGIGYDALLEPPIFSVTGGVFSNSQSLALSAPQEGTVIHYTLDGAEPTESSPVYSTALFLGSKAGTPNNLSVIPTNYENPWGPYYEGWQQPAGEVFKFHVVRARAFKAGTIASAAVTHSYLVDDKGTNRYTLPVVSIATDKANLFDNATGIYTPVNNNMWQSGSAWERPGTIEFFEPNGTRAFAGNIGIRLHGNTTRSRPRKALRIYSRGAGPFATQLFPDKALAQFDTFLLRNGGNDWGNGVIRDMFLQSLAANTSLDRQHGRPVLVFLDGEYWGLHDLRERFDDGYAKYNYGLDELEYVQVEINVDVAKNYIPIYDSGNPALGGDFSNLWDFVSTRSMTNPSDYAAVQDRLDVDNFMEFYQANIFFGNTDWPGNNVRAWRSVATNRAAGAPPRHDARWRYMLYDADFGFGLDFFYVPGNENNANNQAFGSFAQHNTLAYITSPTKSDFSNHPDATMMFRKFLENDEFKRNFITRFCDQLNTAYSRAHVTNRWAQWVATIAPEMTEHVHRWRQPYDWNKDKARILAYGEQRTAAVWTHMRSVFSLQAPVGLTLVVTNTAAGFIRINTLALDTPTAGFSGYPWSGSYFTNFPVTLTALPRSKFRFVEWRKTGIPAPISTAPVLEVSLNAAAQFEAIFAPDSPPIVQNPIPFQTLIEGAPAATFNLNSVFSEPDGQPMSFTTISSNALVTSSALAGSTLTLQPLLRGETFITVTATDGMNAPVAHSFRVLNYPSAHPLASGTYFFGAWASTHPTGTFPEHMIFLQSNINDPPLDTPLEYAYQISPASEAGAPADLEFPYAATSRTRINGLGTNGFSFINTGRGRDVGGALLALDTRDVPHAPVSWLGETQVPNVRIYAIRLQYRVGVTGPFLDVLDSTGQPIQYLRSTTPNHQQAYGPVALPASAMGHEYIQLLWRYYWISGDASARAQLRLDDIFVSNQLTGFGIWQQREFSATELADPDISGPLADPAKTGTPHLLRYASGLSRTDDAPAEANPTAHTLGGARLYTHRRVTPPDANINYAIETITNLLTPIWTPAQIGRDLLEESITPTGDGRTETIEYRLNEEHLPSPQFLRLHITLE